MTEDRGSRFSAFDSKDSSGNVNAPGRRSSMDRQRSNNAAEARARQANIAKQNREKNKEIEKRRRASIGAARKGKTVKVIVRISIAVFVVALCVVAFLLTYKLFYDVPYDPENTSKMEFVIPEGGISDEEVANLLVEQGCIGDARLFKFRTKIYDADYVPGTYKVSPSFTTEKIINILSGYDYSDGTMEE